MRVLVIGGGGREHALAWRLAQSPSVREVVCAPGNPGTPRTLPIGAEAIGELVDHVMRERYDLVVIGPEAPLVAGLGDELRKRSVPTFGCSAAAARIEASKAFAKEVMAGARVPTARSGTFTDERAAIALADELTAEGAPVVIKADGLASGKGVVICPTAAEARETIPRMLAGQLVGRAGARLLVEEFLVGREASCMALVSGERVWPLSPCEDHKTIFDGDRGPMTGGMGAISPTPVVDDLLLARVTREILEPTVRHLAAEGTPFSGLLYAGLMMTPSGPKVLEFNCRFGDPETQPLMARWQGDFAAALLAIAEDRPPEVAFSAPTACTVVLTARGYPGPVQTGATIAGLDAVPDDVLVFHAGTRWDGTVLRTSGGRVLSVTGLGDDLAAARARAYAGVGAISFEGMHFRRDIGARH